MKYVVWGAGNRGNVVYKLLGKERIVAYIDIDKRIEGTKINGLDIISFDEYKERYNEYPIIITPIYADEVESLLIEEKILYFHIEECPPEYMGYGLKKALKEWKSPQVYCKSVALYGCNLFSIMLYEYLLNIGISDIEIFCKNKTDNYIELCEKHFPNYRFTKELNESMEIINAEFNVNDKFEMKIKYDLFDHRAWGINYHNDRISRMKDKYNNKRVFIVANGPSLKKEDLNILYENKAITISMNSIVSLFKETRWRPDYYVLQDARAISKWGKEIIDMDVDNVFLADSSVEYNYENVNNVYIWHCITNKKLWNEQKFSKDFSEEAYNGGSVTYACIQLAYYLGFKEIYLLGVDFNYSTGGVNYADGTVGDVRSDSYYSQSDIVVLNAYKNAEKFSLENGFRIYNATKGGKLEVFERVDFDSLF